MTLDAALYRTVLDCPDRFSSVKMMTILYYNLFNEWPYNTYEITDKGIYDEGRPYNDPPFDKDPGINVDYDYFHEEITKLGYIRCSLDYDDIYVNTNSMTILYLKDNSVKCICNISDAKSDILTDIQKCVKDEGIKPDKIDVGILVQRSGNYYVEDTELDVMDIDVNKTYNDDIPVDAIDDFIKNEHNGLMLFYGEAGTGKTTYIRNLMQKHDDKEFIILDSNLLYDINSHSLLNTFISKKDAIYIIEDCEKLLVSRDDERNPIIAAFLNMTDGILANVISCKFICTFNTDLDNIDVAIKRKGRLKLKYEFKKLSADKVKKILNDDDANDMTIADVIYNEKKNDYSKANKRKIGFS